MLLFLSLQLQRSQLANAAMATWFHRVQMTIAAFDLIVAVVMMTDLSSGVRFPDSQAGLNSVSALRVSSPAIIRLCAIAPMLHNRESLMLVRSFATPQRSLPQVLAMKDRPCEVLLPTITRLPACVKHVRRLSNSVTAGRSVIVHRDEAHSQPLDSHRR